MLNTSTTYVNLRKELRASIGDNSKLMKLHAIVIDAMNRSYGEEKQLLTKLRQEIKNVLNCRSLD